MAVELQEELEFHSIGDNIDLASQPTESQPWLYHIVDLFGRLA